MKQDKNQNKEPASFIRIAKYIASAGMCSRRAAENLILEGRVKVDGKIITSPALNISDDNRVEIDGQIIKTLGKTRLWLYYKPVGLITTHSDPQGRPTVFESLKDFLPRVISVGRLDINSEGLLLLTNSGSLANELESPNSNIERIYKVKAYGNVSYLSSRLNKGKLDSITIDGIIYKPKMIKLLSESRSNSWFEVILTEGKNREIRKIFAHFNLTVNRLIRTKYGKYELGDLKPGQYREVEPV